MKHAPMENASQGHKGKNIPAKEAKQHMANMRKVAGYRIEKTSMPASEEPKVYSENCGTYGASAADCKRGYT